jgi:hypothetical protein
MEKILLELVEKNSTKKELLQDYWNFKDDIQFDFTFTAKFLIYKYNLENYEDLTKNIIEAGFLLFKRIKDCRRCYAEFNIDDRAHFKRSKMKILNDIIICDDCKKTQNNKKVKALIYEIKNHNCRLNEEGSELLKLSYIEKIYLYILIENYKKNFSSEWHSLSVLNYKEGQYVVRNIIEKGYVKEFKYCNLCYTNRKELFNLYMQDKNMIEETLIKELKSYLKLNFDYHCQIVIPQDFESIESWMSEVYSDIFKTKVTIEDVKEIESFIINKRFNEVYKLINLVCEKNSIPWLKDNKFDFEVLRMIRTYNLEVIYNILNYCVGKATSRLYLIEKSKDDKSCFQEKHIYRQEVSFMFEKLLKSDYPVLYTKKLPCNWVLSEEELFVNTYIIEGDQKWCKYTPQEILNMWLKKTNFYF